MATIIKMQSTPFLSLSLSLYRSSLRETFHFLYIHLLNPSLPPPLPSLSSFSFYLSLSMCVCLSHSVSLLNPIKVKKREVGSDGKREGKACDGRDKQRKKEETQRGEKRRGQGKGNEWPSTFPAVLACHSQRPLCLGHRRS